MIQKRVDAIAGHIPMRALIHGGILTQMPYTVEIK